MCAYMLTHMWCEVEWGYDGGGDVGTLVGTQYIELKAEEFSSLAGMSEKGSILVGSGC